MSRFRVGHHKISPLPIWPTLKVVTDYRSLCWPANSRDAPGRLACCSLRLQKFDLIIPYKSGRIHDYTDTLSHAPVDNGDPEPDDDSGIIGPLNASDVITRQRADSDVRRLIDHFEGHPVPLRRHF